MTSILELDVAGQPVRWISPKQAIGYMMAWKKVAWTHGEAAVRLHGGINAITGCQSVLDVPAIIAVRGNGRHVRVHRIPTVERSALFQRDRNVCAYCGGVFRDSELNVDHVMPVSRGGPWSWMNLVTSCAGPGGCNTRKRNRTPSEAKMELLYLPYVPSMHEHLILSCRRIKADQMEWLMAGVPPHSRLRS